MFSWSLERAHTPLLYLAARGLKAPLPARNAAPSDLQYLTDEDIEQLGAAMTRVERRRLRDAVQAETAAEVGVAAGTE